MPDDFNKNTSIEDEIEKSLQKMVEEETTVAKAYVGNADDYKAEQPSDINDGKTRVVPKITDEILKEQQVINKSSQPTQDVYKRQLYQEQLILQYMVTGQEQLQ